MSVQLVTVSSHLTFTTMALATEPEQLQHKQPERRVKPLNLWVMSLLAPFPRPRARIRARPAEPISLRFAPDVPAIGGSYDHQDQRVARGHRPTRPLTKTRASV